MNDVLCRIALLGIAVSLATVNAPLWAQEDTIARERLFAETIFDSDRLDLSSNNQAALDFFQCNCRDVIDYDFDNLYEYDLITTNMNLFVYENEGRNFYFETFRNSGSYDAIFRILGVSFNLVDESSEASWILDYRVDGDDYYDFGTVVFEAEYCSVYKANNQYITTVRTGSDADSAAYGDAARCVAESILGVFGFAGLVPETAWDVSVRVPPDHSARIVYAGGRSGVIRSHNMDCQLSLYRLLPDGEHAYQHYLRSMQLVEQRSRNADRRQCFPSRAFIFTRQAESR